MAKKKLETIEDYQEYVLELEKQQSELSSANEGLKLKVDEYDKSTKEYKSEVDRLKIKNYEYWEQLSTSKKEEENSSSSKDDNDNTSTISLDDIISKF